MKKDKQKDLEAAGARCNGANWQPLFGRLREALDWAPLHRHASGTRDRRRRRGRRAARARYVRPRGSTVVQIDVDMNDVYTTLAVLFAARSRSIRIDSSSVLVSVALGNRMFHLLGVAHGQTADGRDPHAGPGAAATAATARSPNWPREEEDHGEEEAQEAPCAVSSNACCTASAVERRECRRDPRWTRLARHRRAASRWRRARGRVPRARGLESEDDRRSALGATGAAPAWKAGDLGNDAREAAACRRR